MFTQLFLHIIGYDIWFYISHRMLHSGPLWWIHRVHHEKVYPTFLDTYHGHWIESPFQSVGFFLPFAVGYGAVAPTVVGILLVNLRGLLRHDARTVWLIGNHHLIHHKNGATNFGDYWVDRLAGTASRTGDEICGVFYV
jgi:sterol desaturase/sphingolipid hydroxylase (fatty acid hydroxylase superfamily)